MMAGAEMMTQEGILTLKALQKDSRETLEKRSRKTTTAAKSNKKKDAAQEERIAETQERAPETSRTVTALSLRMQEKTVRNVTTIEVTGETTSLIEKEMTSTKRQLKTQRAQETTRLSLTVIATNDLHAVDV
eukprot:jgi/Antlo1/158/1635